MVELFAAIGLGQWFRYVTGAIEISAAVALLIPSGASFGAILLVPTMSVRRSLICSLVSHRLYRSCCCSSLRQLHGLGATSSRGVFAH